MHSLKHFYTNTPPSRDGVFFRFMYQQLGFIHYLKDNNINYKELKESVKLTRLEKVKETIKAEENNSEATSKSNSNITELTNTTKEAVNQ